MNPPADNEFTLSTTVVVLDTGGDVAECLHHIASQTTPPKQVMVVTARPDTLRSLPGVACLAVPPHRNHIEVAQDCVDAAATNTLAVVASHVLVDPDWLGDVLAELDPERGRACACGTLIDSTGSIVRGDSAFTTDGRGSWADSDPLDLEPRTTAFPPVDAFVVSRPVLVELGGFDAQLPPASVTVDLGWRLWAAGFEVVRAPAARAITRLSSRQAIGSAEALAHERAWLRIVAKNAESGLVESLLTAGLLLANERGVVASGSSRPDYEAGAAPTGDAEEVDRVALARFHAITDIAHSLAEIQEARRLVQLRRRRSDQEIFRTVGRPFAIPDDAPPLYAETSAAVTQFLGLDAALGQRGSARLLVIAYDRISDRMAGPGARCWEVAKAIAADAHVTLGSPWPVERSHPHIHTEVFKSRNELVALLEEHDAVLVQTPALHQWPVLQSCNPVVIVDVYDPWLFESLELHAAVGDLVGDKNLTHDTQIQNTALRHGDFFLCASERQRDYWMGALSSMGRVNRADYKEDPHLRDLVDVVPYGCPSEPPVPSRPVIKGVHPEVGQDDILILWSGGTWEWFDPLLVLDAFDAVQKRDPRVRLYFMGLELAGRNVPRMPIVERLRQRASELGLAGTRVLFGNWVPYDERGAYLIEADVGVLATKDLAETRLAFRSRLLDHFWAGLPSLVTGGDVLAEEVEAHGAGLVVPAADLPAMTDALWRLVSDVDLRTRSAEAACKLAATHTWAAAVNPIRRVLEEPWRWTALKELRPRTVTLTEDARRALFERRKRAGGVLWFRFVSRAKEMLRDGGLYPLLLPVYKRLRQRQLRNR